MGTPNKPQTGLGEIDGDPPAAGLGATKKADPTDEEIEEEITRLMNLKAKKTAKAPPGKKPAVARPALRQPLRQPVHNDLSDAEIMRMYEAEDSDQFYIDPDVVPADEVYEWKRLEVYGKEDKAYEAELARRGWTAVQADANPGYFMPANYHGPVIRGGQGLFTMPRVEYQQRARYQQIVARRQVEDQERVLGIAPPGTGPREHPRVKPRVNKDYEAVDVEE